MQDAILEAVVTTLLENSRQAGATSVAIAALSDRTDLTLTIKDDGPGIPPGDRGRVFEPFFTSRRTSGGTGLGLPIARSLLHAQGGEIDLLSGDGGATFGIRLPLSIRR